MSIESILKQVKRDGVEFVSLQFADLLGAPKEIVIPEKEVKNALKNGVWFDGSSVEGFARISESDLFLKPDLSTYSLIPWLSENGKTARLICDIYKTDEEPFENDPRLILKRAVASAKEKGLEYNVGPEPEFYLFKKDETSKTLPMDAGSYFDLSSHEGYRVIKEIIVALKDFGINTETSHHEVGQGQYEIDFNYGPVLKCADNLLTLKYTVKKIAQMYGLVATFMPKPIKGAAGNGMHTHQSLFNPKADKNLFYDRNDQYRLSETAYQFIAGQIKHIKGMSAILCPTVNSYKRLVSGFEAPVYITWASMNRSALIRVPKWFERKPKSARIELRCPDPSCNPYLAFAVMLKAGLDGIERNLKPPRPVEENIYEFEPESLTRKNIELLPNSLYEALSEMKESKLIRQALGVELAKLYLEIKTKEWDEFKLQVTEWEKEKYLELY